MAVPNLTNVAFLIEWARRVRLELNRIVQGYVHPQYDTAPVGIDEGFSYYDSALNVVRTWDGTQWIPPLTAPDESFVRTTSSADQTLPTGVLTILDYDSTTTNNDTANYTVGTGGRITVAIAGIYDITTGVVVQASAVSAASATALGLFVNGELVAVDTAETTLAVDEQRGHSISTQIALSAGAIVDARARVTSVGGVGNGLARRLATLLGSTATQVNHLSIARLQR